MVYLDYSATTKTNDEVLDTFIRCTKEFIGNSNSLHELGVKSKSIIDSATNQIAKLLNVKPSEIIYTSGASESNNLAIKGVCDKYKNRGKHIITTELEHSSIDEPLEYMETLGYKVDHVKLNLDGTVDLIDLENLINDDTVLVSISMVNSETGIKQPIDKISKIIRKYPKCIFHSDMTQAIGKIPVNLENVDLVSFSAHKFYGIKGIGCLIKKEKIELEPLIHGGKSTTIYRSGTPALPLIVSTSKALRLALNDINEKINKISNINKDLVNYFKNYENVIINSTDKSIPHILNISVLNVKPETMLHALEEHNIYISTKTACSKNSSLSKAVFAITNDQERALTSLRISLSHLTTKEDMDVFKKAFDICYKELTNLR